VLPSITNKMLMELARDSGIPVQHRPIDFDNEIHDFTEVAGSGTAVVLSPVSRILSQRGGKQTNFEFGELDVLRGLKDRLVRIQRGEEDDVFGWMLQVPQTYDTLKIEPELVMRKMMYAVSQQDLGSVEMIKAEQISKFGHDNYESSHAAAASASHTAAAAGITEQKENNAHVFGQQEQHFQLETLETLYDKLATSYNEAGGDRVMAAANCTSLLLNFLPMSRRGRILDAGAGTGVAGSMLKAGGVQHLTAFDLSNNMLDQARKRGVYNDLVQGCLPDSQFKDGYFDAVLCAGCLAPGHASPVTYSEFCRVVKPGGLVVFSIPSEYYYSAEGTAHRFAMETLERVGAWGKVHIANKNYFEKLDAHYFVFRRLDNSSQQLSRKGCIQVGEEAGKADGASYIFP